ncbi:hypothetical protein BC826DRAFT_295296 [Russula brevipes]|nr:hypothetical protein BC826DRAFT_295296 [Russula brevipes]
MATNRVFAIFIVTTMGPYSISNNPRVLIGIRSTPSRPRCRVRPNPYAEAGLRFLTYRAVTHNKHSAELFGKRDLFFCTASGFAIHLSRSVLANCARAVWTPHTLRYIARVAIYELCRCIGALFHEADVERSGCCDSGGDVRSDQVASIRLPRHECISWNLLIPVPMHSNECPKFSGKSDTKLSPQQSTLPGLRLH